MSNLFIVLVLLFSHLIPATASDPLISTYIIQSDTTSKPSDFATHLEWYTSIINSLTNDKKNTESSPSRILYSFDVVFNGFAAKLTDEESKKVTQIPGVTAVNEDRVTLKLDTTRSPAFLGLNSVHGLWPQTNFGHNVIIGLVDSGIWPESSSFDDTGLGPVPSKWKGGCEKGTDFDLKCNRKLIGAKSFLKGIENRGFRRSEEKFGRLNSARDEEGHGTHTASTAAGAVVEGANVFGFANGTARGVATKARIAMYKACTGECAESDILAAMESAIKDGVDVLSLSIGYEDPPYYRHVIAIGAFAAVKRNIFVACSAGNSGPHPFSVHNTYPWVTTVGAASIDRIFPVHVLLGNKKRLVGSSLYNGKISGRRYGLVWLENCNAIDIVPNRVQGRFVACNSSRGEVFEKGKLIRKAGGAGMIQLNHASDGEGLIPVPYTLPGAHVGYKDGLEIVSYINSAKSPTLRLIRTRKLTVVGKERAPIVLGFSARGPNIVVPEILKPDLIAPGLNVLAAWPHNVAPTRSPYDHRRVEFNTDSGTSMACPHVAGVGALIRAAHPDWSPAAIQSALMTTSTPLDNQGRLIAAYEDMRPAMALGTGSGHVNPQAAVDPGLIYDANMDDYFKFLCGLNYTKNQLKSFASDGKVCSGFAGSPGDLNYPSFSIVFKPKTHVWKLKRTVTNVAQVLPEQYRVRIENNRADNVAVSVSPKSLIFRKIHEKKRYTVKFKSRYVVENVSSIVEQMVFGSITWDSGRHVVRSPFAVMWDTM